MKEYSIVRADDVADVYAGTDVPGEFRPLTRALESEQLAATLIRVPPHSDFEQGTGHYHADIEELYFVTRGTLTMRFGDDVAAVGAGSIVRVAPGRRAHTATRATRPWRCGRSRAASGAGTRPRSTSSGRPRRRLRRSATSVPESEVR